MNEPKKKNRDGQVQVTKDEKDQVIKVTVDENKNENEGETNEM